MEEIKKKYCEFCGKEMKTYLTPADETRYRIRFTDVFTEAGTKFDKYTGKRNYVRNYTCPDWKDKFFSESPHSNIFHRILIQLDENELPN